MSQTLKAAIFSRLPLVAASLDQPQVKFENCRNSRIEFDLVFSDRPLSWFTKRVQEPIGLSILVGEASQIKPHTPDSEQMMATFSAFAQIERDYASERTKKGLAKLKAQGKILGRRSNFEQWKSRLIEM